MHHQAAGFVLGDAARAEVEQLLVVEPAGGGGVPGALDLAGLDLEVGHGVGLAAVGEHEVAVLLVGLDALRDLADQDVADPDRVGTLALQRTLVAHVALGLRRGVVHEEAVLDVLAGVGEVEAEHLDLTTRSGVLGGRVVAYDAAPEGHVDVLEAGVASDPSMAVSDVDGVVGPVVDADHGQVGAVTDDDLDVVGQGRRADEAQHDGRPAVGSGGDDGVSRRGVLDVGARERDEHRAVELGLGRDRHGVAARGLVPDTGCDAVGRDEAARPEQRAVGRERLEGDRRGRVVLRTDGRAVEGGVAVEAAQPLERREAPDLLTTGRHRVGVDVERPVRVQVGLHALDLERVLNERHQPTAPSICSSMSRFSSRAYSIGSSLAIGSTKPRTIIAIASSSAMPRDIR